MKTMILLLLISTPLFAWTVPAMKVDERLAGIEAMAVEGRQGWLVRQVLTFGDYRTGPVKRSWTKGYDYPFIIRFTAAKEKLSFDTTDASNQPTKWLCAGKLSEQDFRKFKEYFDVNLRTKDVFTCTVVIADQQMYDVVIEDLNQNKTSGEVSGAVRGKGLDIGVRPVWILATGKTSWDTRPLGFEFTIEGEVVGAVETVNDGRVWLEETLSPESRLVLAGLASALLLRSDLADHND